MASRNRRVISRGQFLRWMRAGALGFGAAASGPFFLFPQRASAGQKKLRILQWKHFLPDYDHWFDMFAKEWGKQNETHVLINHVPLDKIRERADAEVAAGKGHDLVMFVSPPARYERYAIDHSEVYQEVQRKNGQMIELAHKSTFNPKTRKYFAFSDSYLPLATHWLKDRWTSIGLPLGPTDYGVLRRGAKLIRDRFRTQCGLGLAPELDSNVALQGLLWSFGGFLQDAHGNVTIRSKGTLEALKYVQALYQESETEEVFRWKPSSNDHAILDGRASCIMNSISISREAERKKREMSDRIMIAPAPMGPAAWLASPHVTQCYVIWEFAENKDGAKQFLADFSNQLGTSFQKSKFCNFPCFPKAVPDLLDQLSNDVQANPHGKYKALRDTLHWTRNLGHPGYMTAAMDEIFRRSLLPRMFATVAKGEQSPEDAAAAAEQEAKHIVSEWKEA